MAFENLSNIRGYSDLSHKEAVQRFADAVGIENVPEHIKRGESDPLVNDIMDLGLSPEMIRRRFSIETGQREGQEAIRGIEQAAVPQTTGIDFPGGGGIEFQGGRFIVRESPAAQQAREQREQIGAQLREQLRQTPEQRGLQLKEFEEEFSRQALEAIEPSLTQRLTQRGLFGDTVKNALAKAAAKIGAEAKLQSQSIKERADKALLDALSIIEGGGRAETAQQLSGLGLAESAEIGRRGLEQSRLFGLAELGEQARQFDIGELLQRENVLRQQDIAQRAERDKRRQGIFGTISQIAQPLALGLGASTGGLSGILSGLGFGGGSNVGAYGALKAIPVT